MEGSNSEDKETQVPGTIMQLLKPVRPNPYSASNKVNWFLINVIKRRRPSVRYFFDMSRNSRYLPKILPAVQEAARYRSCHTIFLLTPTREFNKWLINFPMSRILAKRGVLWYPKKVGKPPPRRKIIKRKANKYGEASPTQLLRKPKLELASPDEGPDPSDLQSPNQTDSEVESEYTGSEYEED